MKKLAWGLGIIALIAISPAEVVGLCQQVMSGLVQAAGQMLQNQQGHVGGGGANG